MNMAVQYRKELRSIAREEKKISRCDRLGDRILRKAIAALKRSFMRDRKARAHVFSRLKRRRAILEGRLR